MNANGKLITSTRAPQKSVIIAMVFRAIGIVFILILLGFFNSSTFRDIAYNEFGYRSYREAISIFSTVAYIALFADIIGTANTAIRFRSYVNVREHALVGTTTITLNSLTPENFSIPYSDIITVTDSALRITIVCTGAKYTVMAWQNKAEALQEIRARIPSRI